MFVCILCIIPLNQNALKWCVLCSNLDLTVFYTNHPCTTVPCNRGIFGDLVSQCPAIWIFFPMLSDNTTICAYPSLSIQCFEHSTCSWSEPKSRGFSRPRYFGLGVNPNPADFLDRGILVSEWTPNPADFLERGFLVSEWTQIPQIFSTAGFWSRSAEPESRAFSRPRCFGVGLNPESRAFSRPRYFGPDECVSKHWWQPDQIHVHKRHHR